MHITKLSPNQEGKIILLIRRYTNLLHKIPNSLRGKGVSNCAIYCDGGEGGLAALLHIGWYGDINSSVFSHFEFGTWNLRIHLLFWILNKLIIVVERYSTSVDLPCLSVCSKLWPQLSQDWQFYKRLFDLSSKQNQKFTKHRVAGRPPNIPLMYNLVLWNRFLIKKIIFWVRKNLKN